jgi:glyoxylase-like metal-dependent hydrolase (beta-lactamase superfamily II)
VLERIFVLAALAAFSASGASGQSRPATVTKLYVFDNGGIAGLDPKLFNFAREELKEVDFTNVSYLIVHPRGTLMFDSGGVPDADFKADGKPVVEGVMSASKPLLPQLAAAGFRPSDITYFALSHYHSDHTGNANAFAGSTWLVQKAERDFMFGPKPQGAIVREDAYVKLKDAKTKVLDNETFDVFGDGSAVLMPTPGHTPGHQVLVVRLPKRGTVILSGDLYHYPEERATGRTPTFEFDAAQSKASRAKIEQLVKDTGAELWIEHDIATHASLPRAPQFVE